jgi:nicotinate-nucleotide pyrophosphorylase (carboxylating)
MLDKFVVNEYLERFLREDINGADITSSVLLNPNETSHFELICKESEGALLCGVQFLVQACEIFNIELEVLKNDGEMLDNRAVFAKGTGRTMDILRIERTVLNILQHLSGVATKVRRFQGLVSNISPNTRVLDTRKTVPGLRYAQKYAVSVGGGLNHRLNLSDGILIKDNHIQAKGGIKPVLAVLKNSNIPSLMKVEIECDTLEQVREVLEGGAGLISVIMLDNFSIHEVKKALAIIWKANSNLGYKAFWTEISGGVSEANLADYAGLGVDYISLGALTHTVKSVDLSLDFL